MRTINGQVTALNDHVKGIEPLISAMVASCTALADAELGSC